jgi:hypothetical protein
MADILPFKVYSTHRRRARSSSPPLSWKASHSPGRCSRRGSSGPDAGARHRRLVSTGADSSFAIFLARTLVLQGALALAGAAGALAAVVMPPASLSSRRSSASASRSSTAGPELYLIGTSAHTRVQHQTVRNVCQPRIFDGLRTSMPPWWILGSSRSFARSNGRE